MARHTRWAKIDPADNANADRTTYRGSGGRGYVALTIPQATIRDADAITYIMRNPITASARPVGGSVTMAVSAEGVTARLYLTTAECDRLAASLTKAAESARLAGAR